MKVRISFVTNSSTSNYLVFEGTVHGEGMQTALLQKMIEGFAKEATLKFEYPKDSVNERIMVEYILDGDWKFKVLARIPYHKAIDVFRKEFEDYFGNRGYEVKVNTYIHAEYDG